DVEVARQNSELDTVEVLEPDEDFETDKDVDTDEVLGDDDGEQGQKKEKENEQNGGMEGELES
ncbi:hypothetical protein TWF225_010346, partial [Orbilia oligospora]